MKIPDYGDVQRLRRLYERRFEGQAGYRQSVWSKLTPFLQQRYSIEQHSKVLDLGCGYGEFINSVSAGERHAMDLNPDSAKMLDPGVVFHEQDCSAPWPVGDLDFVFTSNFFEHLARKELLNRTLEQAHRALKAGGILICLGPNVRRLPGAYWDFWDHHIPLTERSLQEAMAMLGFEVFDCVGSFLPYSMSLGRQPPCWTVGVYLKMPFVWRVLGRQFLVAGRKPDET